MLPSGACGITLSCEALTQGEIPLAIFIVKTGRCHQPHCKSFIAENRRPLNTDQSGSPARGVTAFRREHILTVQARGGRTRNASCRPGFPSACNRTSSSQFFSRMWTYLPGEVIGAGAYLFGRLQSPARPDPSLWIVLVIHSSAGAELPRIAAKGQM